MKLVSLLRSGTHQRADNKLVELDSAKIAVHPDEEASACLKLSEKDLEILRELRQGLSDIRRQIRTASAEDADPRDS